MWCVVQGARYGTDVFSQARMGKRLLTGPTLELNDAECGVCALRVLDFNCVCACACVYVCVCVNSGHPLHLP